MSKLTKVFLCFFLALSLHAASDERYQAYREVYLLSLEAFEKARSPKEKQEASWVLAQLYSSGKGVKEDIDQAIKWYKRAAKHGSLKAREYLISYYFSVKRDLEKGVYWAYKAALMGSDLGMSTVGLFFEQAEDFEKAAQWYSRGAKQKGASSMYYLGLMYKKGLWYEKDEKKARFWLEKAAKRGHKKAEDLLP